MTADRSLNKVLQVRVSEDDLVLVDAVAEQLGGDRSKAVRMMIRNSGRDRSAQDVAVIVARVDGELKAATKAHNDLSFQLQRIGLNVNQITHRLHREGGTLTEDDEELLSTVISHVQLAISTLGSTWKSMTSWMTTKGLW